MRKSDFDTISLNEARAQRREVAGGGKGHRNLSCPQTTLAGPVALEGVGLHTGRVIHMNMHPAAAGFGIVFSRTDIDTQDLGDTAPTVTDIPARYDHVCDTRLSTVIRNDAGTTVATIEHLMAALASLGVDNVFIELDGPEIPVMDGSSQVFVKLIDAVGLKTLAAPRRAIRILKPVVIEEGQKRAALLPGEGFRLDFEIDFDNAVIGTQRLEADFNDPAFRDEILNARTFGFLKDVEAMWKVGLGLGGSLENTVVIDGDKVLNAEGLRSEDEFVRHKILDAVGDLALAGAPLIGRYEGVRSGHALNNLVLRALLADPSAWELVEQGTAPNFRDRIALPAE